MPRHPTRTMVSQPDADPDYTAEELEFLAAMERYKKRTNRRFPTFVEVLRVAKSLGYRKEKP